MIAGTLENRAGAIIMTSRKKVLGRPTVPFAAVPSGTRGFEK